ncbi:MAG: hypothetical protein KA314_04350 [Chloroflexi bacterium]|nr:hypothetical protein [Chloroflexota bacterium]MBP8055044.1 hypothetical protein [Chloroflexota bacterium]
MSIFRPHAYTFFQVSNLAAALPTPIRLSHQRGRVLHPTPGLLPTILNKV